MAHRYGYALRHVDLGVMVHGENEGEVFLALGRSTRTFRATCRRSTPKSAASSTAFTLLPRKLLEERIATRLETMAHASPRMGTIDSEQIDDIMAAASRRVRRSTSQSTSRPSAPSDSRGAEPTRRRPPDRRGHSRRESVPGFSFLPCLIFLHCGGFRLPLDRPLIAGIVNLTPDSFSGDGLDVGRRPCDTSCPPPA